MRALSVRLLATIAAVAGPVSSREPSGHWLVEEGDAVVEIGRCGETLCGHVVWILEPLDESGVERLDVENTDPALRDRKIVGLKMLEGFALHPDESGTWREGRIYDPKNGKTYRCTIRFDGQERLRIRGYVGVPLFGRTTHWTRTTYPR